MKKLRNAMALSLLVFSMNILSNSAFAENVLASNQVNSPDSTQITNQNAEKPAINLDLKNQDNDKNIVPVLELKGGVKEAQEHPSLLKTWLNGNYATGDWGGLRGKLEDHGVTLSGSYTNFDFMNMRGGARSKSDPRYQGLLFTTAAFDTEKMGLWKGGKAVVTYGNSHGNGISRDYIGDWQLINTYDCGRFSQLYEYYYEQSLFNNKFKVKVGKQDANNDFVALDSAFLFNNGGFFIQNTPITTYPSPGLGVMTTIQPVSWFSLKSGFYDGNAKPEGLGFRTMFNGKENYTIMNEAAITHNYKNLKGKYSVGHWISTSDNAVAGYDQTYANAYGIYSGFDQMIFKENAEDDQGLSVFGQFGWAPPDRRVVTRYFGSGLVYKGLIPKRNSDVIGVGMNFARFSGRYDAPHGETVIESFYKLQLTPWLAVQPDFQVVAKPAGVNRNAYALGLKTVISF